MPLVRLQVHKKETLTNMINDDLELNDANLEGTSFVVCGKLLLLMTGLK
jgi:hypothetical protein